MGDRPSGRHSGNEMEMSSTSSEASMGSEEGREREGDRERGEGGTRGGESASGGLAGGSRGREERGGSPNVERSTVREEEREREEKERLAILVAEDNRVNQMLIRKLLVHHGHEVCVAVWLCACVDLYLSQVTCACMDLCLHKCQFLCLQCMQSLSLHFRIQPIHIFASLPMFPSFTPPLWRLHIILLARISSIVLPPSLSFPPSSSLSLLTFRWC